MEKIKNLGQVYTPPYIVDLILDKIGYFGESILNKKVFEPSSGDGVFLIQIVKRFLIEAKKAKLSKEKIEKKLQKNIYACEIDEIEYKKSLNNINDLTKGYNIKWNIFNSNTLLEYKKYKNFFDYVIGNPPYVRTKNIDVKDKETIKREFSFNKGNIDIYITFFELGYYCLNEKGKLGYITPNSYLYNNSYKNFRYFLQKEKIITEITNFKSFKVFEKFSTYTCITLLDKTNSNDFFSYYEKSNTGNIEKIDNIYFSNLVNGKWVLGKQDNINITGNKGFKKIGDFFDVQYGIATMRDKIFISTIKEIDNKYVVFNGYKIEKDILKKVIKGSKKENKDEYIIFPYETNNGKIIPFKEDFLVKNFPNTYNYLLENKTELGKRDMEKGLEWFLYGRSQGLKNIYQEKLCISNLVKDEINIKKLEKEVIIYSGIFITKKDIKSVCLNDYTNNECINNKNNKREVKNNDFSLDYVFNILKDKNFIDYVFLLGKDFSGGYKGITSKIIQSYPIQ